MSTTISATVQGGVAVNLSETITGAGPRLAGGAPSAAETFGNAGANTTTLGADTIYGPAAVTIAPSATLTHTLSNGSLFDNLGNAITLNPGRIKGIYVQLLGATQKAQDGTAGTACSGIHVAGTALVGAARPIKTSSGSPSLEVNNGMHLSWPFDNGGLGYVVTLGATDTITIVNEDAGNNAVVVLTYILGSN